MNKSLPKKLIQFAVVTFVTVTVHVLSSYAESPVCTARPKFDLGTVGYIGCSINENGVVRFVPVAQLSLSKCHEYCSAANQAKRITETKPKDGNSDKKTKTK